MEAPCSFSPPVALIPAYKPEPAVLDIARALLASEEISDVVVVNDGSGAEYDTLFQELADMAQRCCAIIPTWARAWPCAPVSIISPAPSRTAWG